MKPKDLPKNFVFKFIKTVGYEIIVIFQWGWNNRTHKVFNKLMNNLCFWKYGTSNYILRVVSFRVAFIILNYLGAKFLMLFKVWNHWSEYKLFKIIFAFIFLELKNLLTPCIKFIILHFKLLVNNTVNWHYIETLNLFNFKALIFLMK